MAKLWQIELDLLEIEPSHLLTKKICRMQLDFDLLPNGNRKCKRQFARTLIGGFGMLMHCLYDAPDIKLSFHR